MSRPRFRVPVPSRMARGLLVVVLTMSGATCRIGELVGHSKLAILEVDPDSVSDSAAVGSTAPRINPVDVINDGDGDLDWKATIKHGSPWLTLDPDSGRAGVTPTLRAILDPTGLATGLYKDTVVVAALTGTGALEVPVSYSVHPCRTTAISLDGSVTGDLTSADCAAPHRSGRYAQLFTFTGGVGDTVSVTLEGNFNGHIILDTALAPSAPPLAEVDGCVGTAGDACIYYVRLPRTTAYFIEATGTTAADTGDFTLRMLHPGRQPLAPDTLSQRAIDSTTVIATGDTINTTTLLLTAVVSDSDRVDSLRLEAEVRPVTDGFTGVATAPLGPKVGNGKRAWVSVNGLNDNTCYHWQVRAVDQTGRRGAPKEFGGNTTSASDFCTQVNRPPAIPTVLTQYQADGTTVIPAGDTARTTTVVFKAAMTDPDGGQVRLDVEVQPVSTSFTGVPNASSTFVPSGTTATVPSPTLTVNTQYHWQARSVDNSGATNDTSLWTPYPGTLPDVGTDFVVSTPVAELVFTQGPAIDTAGRPVRPAVKVTAQDVNHIPVTTFTGSVTIQLLDNPGGSTLTGRTTVNAVAGVATFDSLVLNKVGTGYTLQAGTGSIVSLQKSSAFNVVPGPVAAIQFTTQPSNTQATQPITPAVVVTAYDNQGNPATTSTGNVVMAIGTNPGGGTLGGTLSQPLAAGLATATFPNLSIDKIGTGYTLKATLGSFSVTSLSFNITPLGTTHLVFTAQPGNTVAGAAIDSSSGGVVVTAQDSSGQTVTTFTGQVTISIGTNPGGGSLVNSNPTVIAQAGVARFTNLRIDKAGNGYTLSASGAGSATSTPFSITASTPRRLAFTAQPTSDTAGRAITPAVIVAAQDSFGNPTPAFTGPVTITIANNPGGGTLTGGGAINAVGGLAGFSNLRINRSGVGYTLQAASGTLTPAISQAFDIVPAPAVSLAFTSQPRDTTAGVAINGSSGGVIVTARDSLGNTATSFTGTVTMTLGANPAGGTLSGNSSAAAASGVAAFGNLIITKAGAGYRLLASSGALTSPLSNSFAITPAPANKLKFTTQPQNTAVLARIDSAIGGVVVTVQDAFGNTTPFSGTVRVQIGADSGGGSTITGGSPISAPTGIATFPNLTINKVGNGFTLLALTTTAGVGGDESTPFNITPGPVSAATSTISASPLTITASNGSSASTITVTAMDAGGNPIQGATVALTPNPTTVTLTQPVGTTNASGVATGTLSSTKAQTVTVSAKINGVLITQTATVTVNPANAATLQFTNPPTNTAAGAIIDAGTGVKVTAFDAFSNVATGFTGNVVMAIGTGTSGAQLSGTKTIAAASGVATFSDLSINKTGNNYTLTATVSGLPIATSPQFSILSGTPTQLVITQQPSSTAQSGVALSPQPTVQLEDANGNFVGQSGVVVMAAVASGPGGSQLSGQTATTNASGTASFTGLTITGLVGNYTLAFSGGGFTPDTSGTITLSAGQAAKLGFTITPSGTAQSGVAFAQQPVIQIQDASGNPVSQNGTTITASVASGPGGATLSGFAVTTMANGSAAFTSLAINGLVGTYTLDFSGGGLTKATSNSISLTTGPATKLTISTQPSSTAQSGVAFAQQPVIQLRDAGGNAVSQSAVQITASIASGPSGTLSNATANTIANGTATFNGLAITGTAGDYTLSFSNGNLTPVTSNTITLSAGTATKLGIPTQPSSSAQSGVAFSTQPVIQVQDANGNSVSLPGITITAGIASGPSATLSSASAITDATGKATFSGLAINGLVGTYTLSFSGGGYSPVTSNSITLSTGPATKLVFTVQPPTSTVAGVAMSPPIQVTVQDAGGNTVPSPRQTIIVAIGTNPGNGALSGTTSVQTSPGTGISTFNNLSIDKSASGYTLVATSGNLTPDTSNTFTIVAATATSLKFTTQPQTTASGSTMSPIVLTAFDAFGNVATGFAGSVTLAITSGTPATGGPGTLNGTTTLSASSGVASFTGLSITGAGTGYTLDATSTLPTVTSQSFDIN